jgi:hypothetical protein
VAAGSDVLGRNTPIRTADDAAAFSNPTATTIATKAAHSRATKPVNLTACYEVSIVRLPHKDESITIRYVVEHSPFDGDWTY